MKQIIIISAMILLGIFIYSLIAGDGDNSLINGLEKFWRAEIGHRANIY
jgi:hypothetical protein